LTRITVCMGSSCFARGNNRNLELILEYLQKRGLKGEVVIKGALCEGRCNQGPNIVVDGTVYSDVKPVSVVALLDHHFASPGSDRS
jgi:NADH:ubiquinone oxidoreductase subunit E